MAADEQRSPPAGLPLPAELLYRVFSSLDFDAKVKCESVCKAWNSLLSRPQTSIWSTVCLHHYTLCKPRHRGRGRTATLAHFTRQDCMPIIGCVVQVSLCEIVKLQSFSLSIGTTSQQSQQDCKEHRATKFKQRRCTESTSSGCLLPTPDRLFEPEGYQTCRNSIFCWQVPRSLYKVA